MAHKYGSGDAYPYPEGPWAGVPNNSRPDLRHQSSSISAISSVGSYQGGYRDSVVSLPSPTDEYPPARSTDEVDISRVVLSSSGTSSIVSPTSNSRRQSSSSMFLPETLRVGTPTGDSPSSRGFNPFRTSQSYEPVPSPSLKQKPSKLRSKRMSMKRNGSSGSLLDSKHGTIHEGEEIDMSLLGSAMPMGISGPPHKTAYSSVDEDDQEDGPLSPMAFDVSSFVGPPQTEEQRKEVERQESNGILTGGLGQGWKPDTTISSSELLNAPPTPHTPSAVTRSMSFRKPTFRTPSFRSPGLARRATVRELGQIEANKRGEIIQVIVEEDPLDEHDQTHDHEPATVDISSFTGGSTSTVDFDQIDGVKSKNKRKSTLPLPQVEVFYPQANWKPFSMRWPYLTTLIVISCTLAAAQEYLLHKGALYTFESASTLSTWSYFSFKYLPTLVAVTFGILWQVTDFEVKRLEAYYQLSKEGGALAAESINVDYITFFNFLRPIRALTFKHYAVAVSSLATLIAVSLVPTLQAASVELRPNHKARVDNPGGLKEIHINAIYSRCLSGVLVLIAILGCVLVYQLQRRPSGLVADVKGIAGIAAMANRSHILMDFKNLDTATPQLIHQTLKSHRYSLRNSSLAPEDKVPLTQAEKDKYNQQVRKGNPHPLMLRLVAGIPFIIGMILFMMVVPIILFQPDANIVTEKAPWFLTALAVCIKLAWGTLETDVRMIEPFYILSKRHQSPNVLTLDYTAMAFGWMPIRAFLNGHFLVGLVGLGSVLAEILTICCTSFANVSGVDFATNQPRPASGGEHRRDDDRPNGVNSGEETFLSFWLSFGLAIAIISFLCLVATFVYSRRRHPFLPRQPNTIASILAFIHQSKMLYDFVGTEKMNNDEMVKKLAKVGKTYGLGWFTGRDGEIHCGVDEEELVSNYKHGDDARKASQPWNQTWETY